MVKKKIVLLAVQVNDDIGVNGLITHLENSYSPSEIEFLDQEEFDMPAIGETIVHHFSFTNIEEED